MMFRRVFLFAGLLLAAPAIAQPRAPIPPQAGAASFARSLQRHVGERHGPVTLRAVHAEGPILVVTVDGGYGWRAFVPVASLSRSYLGRYCREPEVRGFFNGRRALRVDTLEMGRNRWPGQPVFGCP